MDRNNFLKAFGTLTGGVLLFSCEEELIDHVTSSLELDELSIEEARAWFNTKYLAQFDFNTKLARIEGNKKAYKRKTNWDKAEKKKNKNKKDFILLPIEYEDKFAKPGLVIYDDETSYKKEMQDIYIQPIIEKMVVFKEKNKEKAFIVQMSYDPFEMSKESEVNELNLTGMLIHSDWDDNPINGWFVEKGKVTNEFGQSDNSRISNTCHTFYINYNSMTGAGSCDDPEYIRIYGSEGPCNAVNMTVITRSVTVCTNADYNQHNANYQNGTYGSGGGGGGTPSGGSSGPIIRPAD